MGDCIFRRRIAEACRWPEPAGEFVIHRLRAPGMADHRLVRLRTSNPAKLPVDLAARRWGLTKRQADVVAEVTRGATNKEIAATLGISEKTVGHHIGAALAKAGVATRTELVAAVADCNPK